MLRRLMISVLFCGFVMSAVPAQANVVGDVLDKGKSAAAWLWNLVPGAINVVNDGVHWICGKGHEGVHNTAEFLKIDITEESGSLQEGN